VPDADIWQSEGLVTLPVALALRRRRGGRVVYDSRDVHVESGRFARLPGPWRELLRRRERAWVRACDALVTVSRPYADVIERTLRRRPDAIVMNCPEPWARPEVPEPRFHDRLGLPAGTRVVLYLGQLVAHRGIEELCQAIGLVDRSALVLIGFGVDEARLRAFAAEQPHADRIHFLPGVPPDEIAVWTAAADVSAMPVRASTLNHRLNTPTKLFDAMGAGTPVVASDLPGMAPIVRETGCGVLCDPADPRDVARAIREIVDSPPDRRAAFRDACLAAAAGPYSWTRQADVLVDLYRRLHP
jgi:glycosyltransferase involved in cell wall biosynthesis